MKSWPIKLAAIMLSVIGSGAFLRAYAQADSTQVCTSEEFQAFLEVLKPVNGRLTLKLSPSQTSWRVGDRASIQIVSPVDGELLLLSIDSSGAVYPLFPWPNSTGPADPRVDANVPVKLPPTGVHLQMQAPIGASSLVAIVRPAGRPLPLRCAHPLERGVGVRLRSAETGDAPKPPLPKVLEGWGLATLDYTIVEH